MKEEKQHFKIIKDILKDKGSKDYSRGGVYLFWSIVVFYITLLILLLAGISNRYEVEIEKFRMIIDALEYAITLFGGYVFGGKFIQAYKSIKTPNNKQNDSGEKR